MRVVFFLAILLFSISASTGAEPVRCVQQFLSFKGENPGPADGLMGGKTKEASRSFIQRSKISLPVLDNETAENWCAFALSDPEFSRFVNFKYNGRGILPADVVFRALGAKPNQRSKACGQSDYLITSLKNQTPIHSISGFNSRMDNAYEVDGARQAEQFVGDFSTIAISAFVRQQDEVLADLIRILANWADEDAFLGTISCVTKDNHLINKGACTEWQRDDGQDLSGMKDATHSTFLMAALVRTYLALLADHEVEVLEEEHKTIGEWIANGFSKRLKRPEKVYFGLNMGWYWPSINLDFATARAETAARKLKTLLRSIDQLLLKDGSIRNRTTRGDRALWYHNSGISEIVMSLEMARAAEIEIPASIEPKLHKAVALFLDTTQDYSAIHHWAKQRHNSSYNDNTQDWDKFGWPRNNFGGSWYHIYQYRFPDHSNTLKLRKLVKWNDRSAKQDIDYGMGLGCVYNLAAGIVPD